MSVLNDEINLINNSVLGAYLIWKYSISYRDNHIEQASSPGILSFLVLPIIFHGPTHDFIDRTNAPTGLAKFSDKFLNTLNKKSDLLLNIHSRAIEMRELSFNSIRIGITKGLIYLDSSNGRIIPYDNNIVKQPSKIPKIIKNMQKNAEKLGRWFSDHSLQDISFYMKVYF